jgi:hypothetical protein
VEVAPYRWGKRKDTLSNADGDAPEGPAAVLFEVKLPFEGVVDRFDELADLLQ